MYTVRSSGPAPACNLASVYKKRFTEVTRVRQTVTSLVMKGSQEAKAATPPEQSWNSFLGQSGPHLPRTGHFFGHGVPNSKLPHVLAILEQDLCQEGMVAPLCLTCSADPSMGDRQVSICLERGQYINAMDGDADPNAAWVFATHVAVPEACLSRAV